LNGLVAEGKLDLFEGRLAAAGQLGEGAADPFVSWTGVFRIKVPTQPELAKSGDYRSALTFRTNSGSACPTCCAA
jgi:hypothetical protein